jgi:hypothetical protein
MASGRLKTWHYRPNLVRLLAFVTTAALCSATAAAAQVISEESLARIRDGLQKPPSPFTLQISNADFSVFIEGRRPLADVFELPPWVTVPDELAAPKIGTGGVNDVALAHQSTLGGGSIDPGVIGHAISRSIRTRAARAEVKRAIAEYCAAHRDEPGADKICE